MQTMRLSENFTRAEFEHSDTAIKNGIKNVMNEEQLVNATILCNRVLQPARNWYGKVLYINSGFRCDKLNSIVPGASPTSDHKTGRSADIRTESLYNTQSLGKWIEKNLEFDQLIYYAGKNYIHVSFRIGRNRKEILYK